MEQYVGLDVSQDVTHICVVDRDGKKLWEGHCDSTPEAIGETIRKHAPTATKIGLESGHLSTWHWHGLTDMGLPAICIGQPPFQSPPFKLQFCGTGGMNEGAGA